MHNSNMGLPVRTKVPRSQIHGRGLFADQDIPPGTVVWRFDPRVDKVVRRLKTAPARYWRFRHFAYFDRHLQQWVYSMDKTKWMNHDVQPNTVPSTDGSLVSVRSIPPGHEITTNYCLESGLCRPRSAFSIVERATTPP